MSLYTTSFRQATSDDFARAAVFEEFRFKNAIALDQSRFVDRRPHEQPRPAPEAWRHETVRPAAIGWPDLARRRVA